MTQPVHLPPHVRWQSVVAPHRDPEAPSKSGKPRRRGGHGAIAFGIGGSRPDPSDPTGYRYDGATAIGLYRVNGDAVATDSVSNQGGQTAGGAAVELLFWGDVWRYETFPSMGDVAQAVQTMLTSPYLSGLAQYGVTGITLRGSTLVSRPGPVYPTYSDDDVRNLVWALIDDGVFPEPDDSGGRVVYLVIAPPNASTYSNAGARGAHTSAHDTDALDGDDAWVGWSNFGDIDFLTDVLSHELVEALTNSEPGTSAWVMNRSINGGNEIGDACNNTADRLDGMLLQAYWSEQDKACIIPWHGYSAQLITGAYPDTTDMNTIESGIALANTGPCKPPDFYHYWVQRQSQKQAFTLKIGGFPNPVIAWTVGGQAISADGTVTFQASTTHPDTHGENPKTQAVTVTCSFSPDKTVLTVANSPADGCYGFPVVATVSEPEVGSKRTKRVLADGVFFTGQVMTWDGNYTKARADCDARLRAAGMRIVEVLVKTPDLGDPTPPWIDHLPVSLRGVDRERVRELEHLAHYSERLDAKLAGQLRALAKTYQAMPVRRG